MGRRFHLQFVPAPFLPAAFSIVGMSQTVDLPTGQQSQAQDNRAAEEVDGAAILRHQELVRRVPASPFVVRYAVSLARGTRPQQPNTPQFVNEYVEGWRWNTVEYGTGFEWFKGDLEISRYSAVIRPPWTWVGWPMVATQETRFRPKSETTKVRDAYWKAYDKTMDKKTVKALKLSKKPPR